MYGFDITGIQKMLYGFDITGIQKMLYGFDITGIQKMFWHVYVLGGVQNAGNRKKNSAHWDAWRHCNGDWYPRHVSRDMGGRISKR